MSKLRSAIEWIFRRRPPYGRVRNFLVNRPVAILGLLWALSYVFVGILFALIYMVLGPLASPQGPIWPHFPIALHFSLTTQATVGYGDYTPLGAARFLAAAQACVGMVLNAIAFGLVMYRFIRNPLGMSFPDRVVYDPTTHTFWLRFVNLDQDDLHDGKLNLSAFYASHGGFYDIAVNTVLLDSEIVPWMPSIHLMAPRSLTNRGIHEDPPSDLLAPFRLSPLHIVETTMLRLTVSGYLHTTGDTVFATKQYVASDVRCGRYENFDNWQFAHVSKAVKYAHIRAVLNVIHSTPDQDCVRCAFFPQDCPLDVASKLRDATRM
jgi:Ion channel